MTADCGNRNPPAGLFSLFLLLQIMQREKSKEPCDFKICAFVIVCQRGDNLESACPCVCVPTSVQCSYVFPICACLCTYVCLYGGSRWAGECEKC